MQRNKTTMLIARVINAAIDLANQLNQQFTNNFRSGWRRCSVMNSRELDGTPAPQCNNKLV